MGFKSGDASEQGSLAQPMDPDFGRSDSSFENSPSVACSCNLLYPTRSSCMPFSFYRYGWWFSFSNNNACMMMIVKKFLVHFDNCRGMKCYWVGYVWTVGWVTQWCVFVKVKQRVVILSNSPIFTSAFCKLFYIFWKRGHFREVD
jgi:hypothetical protein